MDKRTQIMVLAIASLLSSAALADSLRNPSADKPSTRIDFNKMIDDNNSDRQDLQKSVANKMDVEPAAPADSETNEINEAADQKKLMDFVDVEIGVGQDRPVVDRRYNSVGEPRIATEFTDQKAAAAAAEAPKGDGGT